MPPRPNTHQDLSQKHHYSILPHSNNFSSWLPTISALNLTLSDNTTRNTSLLLSFADIQFSSGQLLSCVQIFENPWTEASQASFSIINFQSLLKLMSIELVMPSNHLIICGPLLLLPSIFPSTRVFSSESVPLIKCSKHWRFSFIISPNEYSGLISFRMDGWDLLAVQGTLKSLLQHHSSKASILQCSAFFIVQLSHTYIATAEKHSFDQKDLCR